MPKDVALYFPHEEDDDPYHDTERLQSMSPKELRSPHTDVEVLAPGGAIAQSVNDTRLRKLTPPSNTSELEESMPIALPTPPMHHSPDTSAQNYARFAESPGA